MQKEANLYIRIKEHHQIIKYRLLMWRCFTVKPYSSAAKTIFLLISKGIAGRSRYQ